MDTVTAISKKRKRWYIWIAALVLLIIGLRIALPYIVLHYANKKLATLDGYYGNIRDIDIALYRGAYAMDGVFIDKVSDKDRQKHTEFFKAERIDFSVQWKALFEGKIVAEVEFTDPVVKYTLHKTVGKQAEKDTTDFINLVKDFVPLKINRFDILNGAIHYVDPYSNPKLDIPLSGIYMQGRGLTNESDQKNLLPASINLIGHLFDGDINLDVKLDPLAGKPTFDLTASLSRTNLVHLNPFFTAYANFDLKRGSMTLYSEFAAKDNNFKGYVKPLVQNLDIVQFEREEGGPLQIAYEAFIGTTAEVFQNQPRETLGTRVEVEGKFTDPKVNVLSAVFSLIRNAFIEALKPAIDNTISINNISQTEKKRFLDFFKREEKKNSQDK